MGITFRWDLRNEIALGRLLKGEVTPAYPNFIPELRDCSSRVLASSHDSDLIFIGRSPESIFDYLSGALASTSWENRIRLLNVSLQGQTLHKIRRAYPGALEALRIQFAHQGITPEEIARWPRPLSLVDLIASGASLGVIVQMLRLWARDDGVDEKAVLRRLRIIGITWRMKTSPNCCRWWQQNYWTQFFKPSQIKSISIPWSLWGYLGNTQAKTSRSFPPSRWRESLREAPPRDETQLSALRQACSIYELAKLKFERRFFLENLAQQRALRENWFRDLLQELRFKSCSDHETHLK